MDKTASFEIVNASINPIFNNTQNNDLAIFTNTLTQKIHLGMKGTSNSAINISRCNIEVSSHLLPNSSGTIHIGSVNNRFSNLYLGNSSIIDFDGMQLSKSFLESTSNAAFISSPSDPTSGLPLSGGTLTGTLTGTTINATTALQQGGSNIDTLFAPFNTSNIAVSASNRAYLSLPLNGGTMTGTLQVNVIQGFESNPTPLAILGNTTFTCNVGVEGNIYVIGGLSTPGVVEASTLKQGGSNLSSYYASIETTSIAQAASNQSYITSTNLIGVSNVAYSTSNRAFQSLPLSGGVLTGGLTVSNDVSISGSLSAQLLMQSGTAISSLFAPIVTSNVAYNALTTSQSASNTAQTALTTSQSASNTAQMALTTSQSASNVAYSSSNRAFGSLALTGGTITGSLTVRSTILQGNSTDSASDRAISCLDSNMTISSRKYITLGKSSTPYNQAEISYHHAGDSSSSNIMILGFHSQENGVSVTANGNVGIGTIRTALSNKLYVSGDAVISTNLLTSNITTSNIQVDREVFNVESNDQETIPTTNNLSIIKNRRLESAQWVTSIDAVTSASTAKMIAYDSSNAVYIVGQYSSAAVPTIYNSNNQVSGITMRSTTNSGVYLVKYNTSGIALWRVAITAGAPHIVKGVATDSVGSIYITGRFTSSVPTIFNPDNTNTVSLGSTPDQAYICKFNSSGTAQWVALINVTGSPSAEYLETIHVDSSNNIYFAGAYFGTGGTITNAGGGTSSVTIRSSTQHSIGIIKFNSSGIAQWFTNIDGTGGASNEWTYDVTTDSTGALYLVVEAQTTTPVIYNSDGSNSNLTTAYSPNYNNFLVKYNANGFAQWCALVLENLSPVKALSITNDSLNNIYVAGEYAADSPRIIYNRDIVDSGLRLQATSNSGYGVFLIKYNSEGYALWRTNVDTPSSLATERAGYVASDYLDNIYLTGYYNTAGTVPIYNANDSLSDISLRQVISSTNATFMIKYNKEGYALSAITIDGTASETPSSIKILPDLRVLISGYYGSTATPINIYNADGTTSTVSIRATSNSLASYLALFSQTPKYSFYKLLANYSIPNGYIKWVMNESGEQVTIKILDYSASTTLQTITISPYTKRSFIFGNRTWF